MTPSPWTPAVVERGVRHARLQNLVAAHAASQGYHVKQPKPDDPRWDVLWTDGPIVWIAEVKRLTPKNDEDSYDSGSTAPPLRMRSDQTPGSVALSQTQTN